MALTIAIASTPVASLLVFAAARSLVRILR
jgi:hypothetical protein